MPAFFAPLLALTFVVVPLDDRPVTRRLPQTLGAIAGVRVAEPPRATIGRYLTPGDGAAILRWLRDDAPRDATDVVVSSDMVVYGGLVASRAPSVGLAEARGRALDLANVRAAAFPRADFSVFGTVMRLAPTGVPPIGAGAGFFAAAPVWPDLQTYANLPDPPQTDEQRAYAARLRTRLGPALDQYLGARARDRELDLFLLRQLAEGAYDRVVLGQDDAGPKGLHLSDLAALRAFVARWSLADRAAIEPGADELAMALVARALARRAAIAPRVRVIYSRSDGGTVNDPLEFAPIDGTVGALIRTCGARRVDREPADIDLYVRVAGTPAGDERAFERAIEAGTAGAPSRSLVAVADLSFLATRDYAQHRALFEALLANGAAARIDGFASWNTVANTVGTVVPEAIAVLAGRRLGTYDPTAHQRFTVERYVDDVIFHTQVRPQLEDELAAAGTTDHTLLLPDIARATESRDRALLWPQALDLLGRLGDAYRDAGMTISLPWDRTFETEIDLRLARRAKPALF